MSAPTVTVTTDALLSRIADSAKPFAVICRRFDGSDREYQRYETAELAELVARRLRELGLEAHVVAPGEALAPCAATSHPDRIARIVK